MILVGAGIEYAAAHEFFRKSLDLYRIKIEVLRLNESSQNTLRVLIFGTEGGQANVKQQINGTVVGAEVADLDGNGSPEFYVFVQSVGSGAYGSIVGYTVKRSLSVSPILLPELTDDAHASAGYMGHDRFAVSGARILRQFPLYRLGDTNAHPTGGSRQLSYRLIEVDGRWLLQLVVNEIRHSH